VGVRGARLRQRHRLRHGPQDARAGHDRIWRNRWTTDHTVIECREALAFPGAEHHAVILRRVEAIDGDARVRVRMHVRAGHGHRSMHHVRQDDAGRWLARTGDLWMRWTGAADAKSDRDGELFLDRVVPAGRHHDFVLEIRATASVAGEPATGVRARGATGNRPAAGMSAGPLTISPGRCPGTAPAEIVADDTDQRDRRSTRVGQAVHPQHQIPRDLAHHDDIEVPTPRRGHDVVTRRATCGRHDPHGAVRVHSACSWCRVRGRVRNR